MGERGGWRASQPPRGGPAVDDDVQLYYRVPYSILERLATALSVRATGRVAGSAPESSLLLVRSCCLSNGVRRYLHFVGHSQNAHFTVWRQPTAEHRPTDERRADELCPLRQHLAINYDTIQLCVERLCKCIAPLRVQFPCHVPSSLLCRSRYYIYTALHSKTRLQT